MALNGFLIGTKGDTAEVLTNSGRIVRVPAARVKGLPPVTPSKVRQEAKATKGTPRQLLAFDYLVHVKGWKPHQAAAMVGRLSQESGPDLNPKAVGDNGTAFGIAQWRGPRNVRRLQFHRKNGNNPNDLFAELDYFDYELRNHESKAYNTISAARTIEEAAAGMMHYERPAGYTVDNPEAGHGWDNTLKFSEDLLGAPSDSFDAIEGPEPMAMPDPDDEEIEAEEGPTRLADVIDFTNLGRQKSSSVMDDLWKNVYDQTESIQSLIDQGTQAQMNFFKE